MNSYSGEISAFKFLAEDVVEITFKLIVGKMDFTPGQFIIVEVSKEPSITRAYSVVEYNLETNEIKIGVKKVQNGQATTIIFNDFKVGMNIQITGPMGGELIVDKSAKELLLAATGIGITPMICILNDLVATNYNGKIDFLYGARTKNDLVYSDEIIELASKNPNINFIPVLSREALEGFKKGRITDFIKDIDLSNKTIYMCGSEAVVTSFKEKLIELGFDMSKFKSESK